jgi:hypothetical protein
MFITVKIFQPGKAQGPYSQGLIFFVICEWPNKLECYITLGWKGFLERNTLA